MEIAKITARRSKDPNAQNGACIASEDGRILSAGYNGFPRMGKRFAGLNNDDAYSWEKSEDMTKDRLSYVVHAEANAILNFKGDPRDLEGSTLYATQIPCNECAKLIAQSGIGKVVYLEGEDKPRVKVTRKIFYYSDIELQQYDTYGYQYVKPEEAKDMQDTETEEQEEEEL